ncbi:hypothetical protein SGL43_04315 [Streptomyces globisporus]|uniref:Uncharacterized protein n=1 Tax=Streptomyces globisporus TaxID=1908 RepID=A0ABM9H116_STRGL|nr:hypothetical protein SGL43_04315 [Streptomyces globisporus]
MRRAGRLNRKASVRPSSAVRYADSRDHGDLTSVLLGPMTTTSSRTLATEAISTPGARCMCRMRAF